MLAGVGVALQQQCWCSEAKGGSPPGGFLPVLLQQSKAALKPVQKKKKKKSTLVAGSSLQISGNFDNLSVVLSSSLLGGYMEKTPNLKLLPWEASVSLIGRKWECERLSRCWWCFQAVDLTSPANCPPSEQCPYLREKGSRAYPEGNTQSLVVYDFVPCVPLSSLCDFSLPLPGCHPFPIQCHAHGWPTGTWRWMHRVSGQQVQEITLQPPPSAVQICTSLFYSAAGFLTK